MESTGVAGLDAAFAALGQKDYATARPLIERVLTEDPNSPFGLLAWGDLLRAEGSIDAAVDAHQAAVQFAPVNAHAHFALAASLFERGSSESPYFRGPTLAQARTAAERALYLAPGDEPGTALLLEIVEQELADAETTRDETPPEILGRSRPSALEVRGIRDTSPSVPQYMQLIGTVAFWRSVWWIVPTVAFIAWLIWSWVDEAFTWVNLAVTALIVYGFLLIVRVWLGPRMEQRRRQVEF